MQAAAKSKSKSTSPWFLLLCNCCCCCCWLWACSSSTAAEQNDASSSSRLASGVRRHVRSLGFPEGSGMGIFFAVAIPIDVPDKSVSMSFYFEANYLMPPFNATLVDDAASILLQQQQQEQIGRRKREAIDRRLFYRLLQNKLESYGYNGPACLRRTVCEAATYPFHRNGLLGDLLRIAFRPSTTLKEDLENSDELEAAERAGDCAPFNAECPISFLDTFSSTM